MTDDPLQEAARVAIKSLKEEEFIGTVDVGDLAWDVYVHPLPKGALAGVRSKTGRAFEDAITVALRLDGDGVQCGLFVPGRLTLAQATECLA